MRRVVPLLLLLGCTEPATQLIVSVGSDYDVPEELSYVEAHTERCESPDTCGGESSIRHPYQLDDVGMPFSFGVAPKEGEEDLEIMVIVEGFSREGGRLLVSARARTGFIKHKTLNLPLFLAKSCSEVWDECTPDETCENGDCVSADRPPENLNPYDPNRDPNVMPPPPRTDGGTPEDGGMQDDTGVPDDSGVPPDDCTMGAPRLITSVNLTFDPTLDLLAANLDGDPVTELVAARSEPSQSPIAVLDYDACDMPVVTSSAAYGELRQGLLYSNGLFAVERRKISRWQYSGPNMLQETTPAIASAVDLERLVFGSAGGLAVANIDGSGWSYVAFNPASGFGATTSAPARPKGFSAELSGTYFHGDDLGLRAITPGSAAGQVALVPKVRDPVISEANDGLRVIAARANDQELLLVVWNVALGSVVSDMQVDFGARIISGPIVSTSSEDSFIYVLLENGRLTGCKTHEGQACEIFSQTHQFPTDEVDEDRAILTAWVDQDLTPDVVFVSKRGKVFFLNGGDLSIDAAPMIDLGQDARKGSAIAHNFYQAFQRQGSLLVVPHNQKLSLVGFLGKGDSMSPLWLQQRRDARRSASEP